MALVLACQDVSVTAIDVADVVVEPSSAAVLVGQSTVFRATVRDASGNPLEGRTVRWTSADTATAAVDDEGVVRGVGAGATAITAASGGASGTAVVTVFRGGAIQLSPGAVGFEAAQGGSDPPARSVTVLNSGDRPLEGLEAAVRYAEGGADGWLEAELDRSAAPATLTVRARTGDLPEGEHRAWVEVSAPEASNSPQLLDVSFQVREPDPAIALEPDSLSFDAVRGGPAPASRAVSVTNTGGGSLEGLGASVGYGEGPSGWVTASLTPAAAPATLTVGIQHGELDAGTYQAVVEVSAAGAANTPQAVRVALVVTEPPAIALDRDAVSFEFVEGGEPPEPETVRVTNDGGGELTELTVSVRYDPDQPDGWLEAALGSSEAPTDLELGVDPDALEAGAYGATVEVASPAASNSPREVRVTLDVLPAPSPPAAPDGLQAEAFSSSRIDLSWNDNSEDEDEFRIERSQNGGVTWTELATVDRDETQHSDTGLQGLTLYAYRVQACSTAGCSGYSNVASALTPP